MSDFGSDSGGSEGSYASYDSDNVAQHTRKVYDAVRSGFPNSLNAYGTERFFLAGVAQIGDLLLLARTHETFAEFTRL